VFDARRFVLPIVCAAIAEGLLILLLAEAGGAAAPASLLLVLEAGILGFVFGPRPGIAGAVLPIVVLGVGVIATDASRDRASDFAVIVFVMLLLGFTAGMAGALRGRYGRPPR
jgi:hypothetical protein